MQNATFGSNVDSNLCELQRTLPVLLELVLNLNAVHYVCIFQVPKPGARVRVLLGTLQIRSYIVAYNGFSTGCENFYSTQSFSITLFLGINRMRLQHLVSVKEISARRYQG